jgi:pimeloyl-ACP methyl ester carboxylesterase
MVAALGCVALVATMATPSVAAEARASSGKQPGAHVTGTPFDRDRPSWDNPLRHPVGAPPTNARQVGRSLAGPPRTDTRSAKRAIALGAKPCKDGSGALCGQFVVPLDWNDPGGPTAGIDFKLIVHSAAGPAVSTAWWNGGGPGPSTTRNDPWVPDYLFAGLLRTHDVLLTDVRGTGSTAPKCPSLRQFVGYWPGELSHAPTVACSDSIADRIDTYGSASTARDLNALRKALGIPQLDMVGNSYGAMPATAYVTRFPGHTRSLVISSGIDVEATLRAEMLNVARGTSRIVAQLCARSAGCRAGVPNARAALAAGVQQLHDAPVEGDSISAFHPKTVIHVTLTEGMLFGLLQESDGSFLGWSGQAAAAMISLGQGDEVPALRLAADATDMLTIDEPYDVPPRVDSPGGYAAIECSDYQLPWPQGLPLDQRIPAAAASVSALGISDWNGAWDASSVASTVEYADWQQLINCNYWPDVNAGPVVSPRGYPDVPTLVMTSDFDTRVPLELAKRTAARWPNSQLLDIGGALHGAAFWSCGPSRLRAFIRDPGSQQEPCDPSDFPAYRAVGQFPVTSADAIPLAVDPSRSDSSTVAERKMAAVALQAALDANNISNRQPFSGRGAGLRGGHSRTSSNDTGFRLRLFGARFAEDVAVDGTMVLLWDGTTPTIDITFTSDDGSTGHLKVAGEWNEGRSASAPKVLPVSGRINGHKVALLLPL